VLEVLPDLFAVRSVETARRRRLRGGPSLANRWRSSQPAIPGADLIVRRCRCSRFTSTQKAAMAPDRIAKLRDSPAGSPTKTPLSFWSG